MTDTPTAAMDQKLKIRIFINHAAFFAPEPAMTGHQLLALAGLPSDNQLFLEVPGHGDDLPISPDTPFALKSGMKFYDVPVGTFG